MALWRIFLQKYLAVSKIRRTFALAMSKLELLTIRTEISEGSVKPYSILQSRKSVPEACGFCFAYTQSIVNSQRRA